MNVAGSYQPAAQSARAIEQSAPPQQESAAPSVVGFERAEVISSGYTNTETIRLRESPSTTAAVTAVLKFPTYVHVEILGSTPEYLRIRIPAASLPLDDKNREGDREGWVAWGEVVPPLTAIVLDAETGKLVSRLAFNHSESNISVAFSPDNSHAVFFGDDQAYEVNIEDYTLAQSFTVQLDEPPYVAASFFYGSTDNLLYAALSSASTARLDIMRVTDNGTPAPEISERAVGFSVSPDGRTGFILHEAGAETGEVLIDVLDLQGMRVSNTLTLRGENLPTSASEIVTSADGSELYFGLFPSRSVISVIETHTGHLLREIPTGTLKDSAQYLSRRELVGTSLLFRRWGEDETKLQSVWLDGGKTSKAQAGIDNAVEANGVRLAVNDSATRLFKLDAEHRIREKYRIDRPDVRFDQSNAESFGVYNLFASPDGKRLIVIIGMMDGC
jgi:hypothetical protein